MLRIAPRVSQPVSSPTSCAGPALSPPGLLGGNVNMIGIRLGFYYWMDDGLATYASWQFRKSLHLKNIVTEHSDTQVENKVEKAHLFLFRSHITGDFGTKSENPVVNRGEKGQYFGFCQILFLDKLLDRSVKLGI